MRDDVLGEDFLGGVVEGFYGQPWSHLQRLSLFQQLANAGLNTYFYSPKDDLKHRAAWREMYTAAEVDALGTLVRGSRDHGLHFIFGLSPGLDIRFTDPADLQRIRDRFQQILRMGVRHFALLFDDLPGNMSDKDRRRFDSVAAAQSSVTNEISHWLRAQNPESRLLFCPTPYCDRMVSWKLGGADYLDTIGDELEQEVDVLWTGPEIISQDITVDDLARLTARIKRQPVIWDNLHANDYDMRRAYCGPYSRPPEMRDHVRGILSNPNNEFALNYVPLRTLGEYLSRENYEPRAAFESAVKDWARQFETLHSRVSAADLLLLCDCYYLPHQHGTQGDALQRSVQVLLESPAEEWGDAFSHFEQAHASIVRVFDQLTQLRDRELFYAWSRRIWELREELDLLHDFVNAKRDRKLGDTGFASETHLPATCRGGIVADLQRRLTMTQGRFHTP